jgi:hypothetical protein
LEKRRTRFEYPEDLLSHLGIEEPEQIDLEAIAYYCGAKVDYAKLTTCAARIVGIGDRSIITINSLDKADRQRFSIGHELGHWMHDRGSIGLSCTAATLQRDWNGDNKEARANRFSAGLLMPKSMFQPRIGSRRLDFRIIDKLHKEFDTSITATAIRAVELTETAAMLVFSAKEVRRKFKRSAIVPFDVCPLWDLHQEAFAFDILFGAAPSMYDARKIAADKWLKHPAARRFDIYEHTLKVREGVISLLSWDDPQFTLALSQ